MASKKAAKNHIEEIRRGKFSIGVGAEPNPLTEDLHNSVHNLSLELYTKDIHFLMELIQNAEDNEYPEGAEPSLEFVLTSKDITGTGAPMTLLVFNNEVGFSRRNMESICSVGRSTKKGRRDEGFVGEKGIGFKSVFLVSKNPYIFSRGYQVRFSDEPSHDCGIGYIVPEWVEMKPTTRDINHVYGSEKKLPITTIILPLKPEKVTAVKKQLSDVHPELLLFLSKISHLSVREHVEGSANSDMLSSIYISSRNELVSTGNENATSSFVQLSAQEGNCMKCWYYIWRQVFPVKSECKVGGRREVSKWTISLAFPFDERLTRGATPAGIFAFLPTEMVTGFPFIIQADFILASSREVILMDSQWNQGILDCIPSTFVNAFVSYLDSSKKPLSNLIKLFKFLPLNSSSFAVLNGVRESIRTILKEKPILLSKQMVFCKPVEMIRLLPAFRSFFKRAKHEGLSLNHVPTEGRFILHHAFDDEKHDQILNFLGVNCSTVDGKWYWKCICSCKLMTKASEDTFLYLLCFIMDNLHRFNYPRNRPFNIPLVNLVSRIQNVTSAIKVVPTAVYYADSFEVHSLLSKFSMQFESQNMPVFMSNLMHRALMRHKRRSELVSWLREGNCLIHTTVHHYIDRVLKFRRDSEVVISLAHLLYHSFEDKLFPDYLAFQPWSLTLPIVDEQGNVCTSPKNILVPASGSKWMKLFGVNPFKKQMYIELGEIYADSREIAGRHAPHGSVLSFMMRHTKASDLPELCPPDVELPIFDALFIADQAFLLLGWIQKNSPMPKRFLSCIRSGKWMKTSAGVTCPDQSLLLQGNPESVFIEMTKVLGVFPIIDEQYYRGCINQYKDVLKSLGVRVVSQDSYAALDEQITHLVSSEMTKDATYTLLKYLKYSKKQGKLSETLLKTLNEKEWLKTTQGNKPPSGSLFLRSETDAIAQITKLSVVDEAFYGDEINNHVPELELLGVVVESKSVYNATLSNFTFPPILDEMKKESMILLLRCIREVGPSHLGLIEEIRNGLWMRTNTGMRWPSQSIISDTEWFQISVAAKVPMIDEGFYGEDIRSFMGELKTIGVAVDFDGVQNAIATQWKSVLASVSLKCEDVLSLLNFIKCFREQTPSMLHILKETLASVSFLKTRLGFKSPPSSILFDFKWGMLVQFVDLPLIDDSFYGIAIYEYKDELEEMGVIVDFDRGSNFVATGLKLPKMPGNVGAKTCFILLASVRSLLNNSPDNSLPQPFLDNLCESKWLKTNFGYQSPKDSMLFDPLWPSALKPIHGPFLDLKFYGTKILSYRKELKAVSVKVEIDEVCMGMYKSLHLHQNLQDIQCIYNFLNKCRWKPSSEDQIDFEVWIPDGTEKGNWVKSRYCVLYDRGSLLSSTEHQVYVLSRYYPKPLLQLFSSAFKVQESPSVSDFVSLWETWEHDEHHEVTHDECCYFWECIVANWNANADILKKKITKLPAYAYPSENNKICFMAKDQVCIPDDPDLESIFNDVSTDPLFVWYPKQNERSILRHRLSKVYASLGVKTLSELVKLNETSLSLDSNSENGYMRDALIVEGLVRIILGFLAGPHSNLSLKERHETVESLLQFAVCETDKPVSVPYILQFPSTGKMLLAKADRIVYLAGKPRKLFVHKSGFDEKKPSVEFVTYFAQEISRFVSEKVTTTETDDLYKLIQMGFAFGFDINAVTFLLKREKLQILEEDAKFISSVFCSGRMIITYKRKAVIYGPHPPLPGGESVPSEGGTMKRKRARTEDIKEPDDSS